MTNQCVFQNRSSLKNAILWCLSGEWKHEAWYLCFWPTHLLDCWDVLRQHGGVYSVDLFETLTHCIRVQRAEQDGRRDLQTHTHNQNKLNLIISPWSYQSNPCKRLAHSVSPSHSSKLTDGDKTSNSSWWGDVQACYCKAHRGVKRT